MKTMSKKKRANELKFEQLEAGQLIHIKFWRHERSAKTHVALITKVWRNELHIRTIVEMSIFRNFSLSNPDSYSPLQLSCARFELIENHDNI